MLPKLTVQLPACCVNLELNWKHFHGLDLVDPEFGVPGCIDVLLGADLFSSILLHGWQKGPWGTPVALETHFSWILMGSMCQGHIQQQIMAYFSSHTTDELLCKFWEVENFEHQGPLVLSEESSVLYHFHKNYSRNEKGRYVVRLPRKTNTAQFGKSRSNAVRWCLRLEQAL